MGHEVPIQNFESDPETKVPEDVGRKAPRDETNSTQKFKQCRDAAATENSQNGKLLRGAE